MIFKVGQYLEFDNSIAKINKIEGNVVKLRKMTSGQSYDYQQLVKLDYLQKLFMQHKVKIIDYLTIMSTLAWKKYENRGSLR